MQKFIDLSRYLHSRLNSGSERAGEGLSEIIAAIAEASLEIAALLALGKFAPTRSAARLIEIEPEIGPAGRAQALIVEKIRGRGVKEVVCAGRDEAIRLSDDGPYVVAIDALDGASNIDTNMSLGTIFSVSFAGDAATGRSGTMQLAAGFIVYGPQTNLVLTLGHGVDIYTLDRDARVYRLADESVQVSTATAEYAIDASNYRHWPSAIRTLIDDHREGITEPGAQAFNMRWIGSLVAETYRILKRGGVFLCPPDASRTCERGCQRLLTSAHPIAFIMEQAGGAATTGYEKVIDRTATRLDERTALIFGSRDTVERIERLHALPESVSDASPLFGTRGLFRI